MSKAELTWQDIRRIVEIADKLCPYASVKLGALEHEFQTEESYYKEVLRRYNDGIAGWCDEHNEETPRFRPCAKERYKQLLHLSEKAWDRKLTCWKSYDDTRIRMFVSYKMREEGYSYGQIGKAMDRHHSSIINQVKRMNNVFDEPVFYAEEVSKYELFNEMVKEYDGE